MPVNNLAALGEWMPLATCRLMLPRTPGLYIFRNKINGKEYIGISKDVRTRFVRHMRGSKKLSLLYRAFDKHGKDVFEICLYAQGEYSELLKLEISLIAERGTQAPGGYNITAGGQGSLGYKFSDERKRRHSQILKGRVVSEETRQRCVEAWKHRDPEIARKAGRAKIGSRHSEETKRKVSASKLGSVVTAETRKKISVWLQNRSPEQLKRHAQACSREILRFPLGASEPIEIPSLKEAAALAGCAPETVRRWLHGAPAKNGDIYVYAWSAK